MSRTPTLTRVTARLLQACCALLVLPAWAQRTPPAAFCPLRPAECQINSQTFHFGRHQAGPNDPPINGNSTLSVTCTRAPVDNLQVEVQYALQAVPPTPGRQMRNDIGQGAGDLSYLAYDMFVDPGRTQYWGNGDMSGTFVFTGSLSLDNRNRVGSLAHIVYGTVPTGQGVVVPGQWLGVVGLRLEYTAVCVGNGNGGGPNRAVGRPGIRGGIRN